jgi:hypothetical protein
MKRQRAYRRQQRRKDLPASLARTGWSAKYRTHAHTPKRRACTSKDVGERDNDFALAKHALVITGNALREAAFGAVKDIEEKQRS